MDNRQTVTALFENREEATRAVNALADAGVSRERIRVTPPSEAATTSGASGNSYDAHRDEKGFWASLADFFMPDDDRHTYAEAMNRGSIMVSAFVTEDEVENAEAILERYGAVNVDERVQDWRNEGWTGYSAPRERSPSIQGMESSTAIPEVEERLRVGKRRVNSGRVRVRSYVVETPVTENVNLHSESVEVERRPVDRSVSSTDDAFKERTIDVESTSEEAVISKDTRVTGEVLVRKQGSDRTETVTDKVRSTKVEVEEDGNASTRGTRSR